jgi:phosphate/sulfate permease
VILAGVIAAIIWNLLTWVERIPSSSSNLLVVAGAKRLRTVSECN